MAAQFRFLIGVLALLWGIEIVDVILGFVRGLSLDGLGIRPRKMDGLIGIPLAPFLHGGFGHLAGNSVPLLVLSSMALFAGSTAKYFRAVAICAIGGSLGTWIFGLPGTVHIGASGIVFGLAGYVFTKGIVSGSARWIVLSILVVLLYGGFAKSLLDFEAGISWTGHAFGLAAGILAAWTEPRIPDSLGALPR